jgi:hypothetical protein
MIDRFLIRLALICGGYLAASGCVTDGQVAEPEAEVVPSSRVESTPGAVQLQDAGPVEYKRRCPGKTTGKEVRKTPRPSVAVGVSADVTPKGLASPKVVTEYDCDDDAGK